MSDDMRDDARGPVSLDDIVGRGTPVQWPEAVAVVEELCNLLTSSANGELPVPPLGSVLITEQGAIAITPRSRGERTPAAAARTLHALMSTSNVPVALRLFVTQANSSDAHGSIGEFAAALAYFGKPHRVDLIRALYERHAAQPAGAKVPRPELSFTAQAENEPAKPAKRRLAAWAAAAAAASVFATGFWLWSTQTPGPAKTSLTDVIARTKGALEKFTSDVRRELEASSAPTSKAEAHVPAPSRRRQTSTRRAKPPAAVEKPDVLASVRSVPQFVEPEVDGSSLDESTIDPLLAEVESVKESAIYSRTDLDVKPPIILNPHLPTPSTADKRSSALNTMELVVSENGTVEQVRLLDGPRRMPDMMLLSGAKTWRFRPATKDGEPVRYRAVVAFVGVP